MRKRENWQAAEKAWDRGPPAFNGQKLKLAGVSLPTLTLGVCRMCACCRIHTRSVFSRF